MQGIHVTSEILPLKKVLLHRPGEELEHLYPESLPQLLFDDIPFLARAQEEHDHFSNILRDEGVEVVYVEDLLAEVFQTNPAIKNQFIDEFVRNAGLRSDWVAKKVKEQLLQQDSDLALVMKMIAGLAPEEVEGISPRNLAKMVGREPQVFLLDPIPNLYFTRDTFASIGHSASLHHMFSPIRQRETIFAKYILEHHPDFRGTNFFYTPEMPPSIEGGDILVLNERVIAVGLSQRTGPGAVETLAQNIFESKGSTIDTVLAVKIPSRRAFMHLDTVFTQLDKDKFVIHPGILENIQVFRLEASEMEEDNQGAMHMKIAITEESGSFADILARHLQVEKVTLIHCGGEDRIAAEREQWNDGSNSLCIRPGTVIVYDRNTITNALLEENGIECLEMPSSELSRGRGGPRCMSMPLIRED